MTDTTLFSTDNTYLETYITDARKKIFDADNLVPGREMDSKTRLDLLDQILARFQANARVTNEPEIIYSLYSAVYDICKPGRIVPGRTIEDQQACLKLLENANSYLGHTDSNFIAKISMANLAVSMKGCIELDLRYS